MNLRDVPMNRLLAHKPPMLLIDRLTEVFDDGVRCEVDIHRTSPFAQEEGVPAYVAIEYMAQTIGVYDGWGCLQRSHAPRIGYLVGTRQLELACDHFFFGQCLTVDARLVWDGEKLLQFRCSVADKELNDVLATATINVFAPTRESGEG